MAVADAGRVFLALLKTSVRVLVAALLLMLGFGFILETVRVPPAFAIVYASDERHEFISPPFLEENPELRQNFLRITTYSEVMNAGYDVERRCGEAECWTQDGRTISGRWFERLGLLPSLESRWNADGSWNW